MPVVCVLKKRAVLILGKSGSGKSSLALSLVANGAQLVCDDRAQLQMKNKILMMTKPPSLPGALEVRGLGLISVPVNYRSTCRPDNRYGVNVGFEVGRS